MPTYYRTKPAAKGKYFAIIISEKTRQNGEKMLYLKKLFRKGANYDTGRETYVVTRIKKRNSRVF